MKVIDLVRILVLFPPEKAVKHVEGRSVDPKTMEVQEIELLGEKVVITLKRKPCA